MAERAYNTLLRAQETTEPRCVDPEAVMAAIKDPVGENCRYDDIGDIVDYLTGVCCGLTAYRNFDKAVWTKVFSDFKLPADVAESTCDLCFKAANSIQADEVEEEEGQDLCNCVFTLGYGSLTLLNNTRLYLKRGGNYGLLGPNDCGKTTLMRAINNEQVEGFPPKSELKTAFVEHGIGEAEPECDWSPFDYLLDEPVIKAMFDAGETNMEKMEEELTAVGFNRGDKLDMTLGQLSGGWKMKMGLVRAKMMDADILMMDEPTGHLDKFNIAWLIDYVNSLKKREKPVTVIAVSHDTEYLEKTTTHILEFENRKLTTFRGNVREFVKKRPEAKIYFEITKSAKVNFEFPPWSPRRCQKPWQGFADNEGRTFPVPQDPQAATLWRWCSGLHALPSGHRRSKRSWKEYDDQVFARRVEADQRNDQQSFGQSCGVHVTARFPPHREPFGHLCDSIHHAAFCRW